MTTPSKKRTDIVSVVWCMVTTLYSSLFCSSELICHSRLSVHLEHEIRTGLSFSERFSVVRVPKDHFMFIDVCPSRPYDKGCTSPVSSITDVEVDESFCGIVLSPSVG